MSVNIPQNTPNFPSANPTLATLPVWVVDEDDVRFSLRFALATHNFNAFTFSSCQEFLDKIDPLTPGCIVLDATTNNKSPQDIQAHLNALESPISIIMISAHGSIRSAVQAMTNGAVSFLEKPVDPEELVNLVKVGLERSLLTWQKSQAKALLKRLSRREAQIFDLIGQGFKNQEIADSLFLSTRTVEVHRLHINNKLGNYSFYRLLYDLACSHINENIALEVQSSNK